MWFKSGTKIWECRNTFSSNFLKGKIKNERSAWKGILSQSLSFKRIITFELVLDLLERNDEGSDKLHDFLSIDIAGGMHSSWLSSLLHLHAVIEIEGIIRNNCFDFQTLQICRIPSQNIETYKHRNIVYACTSTHMQTNRKNPPIIWNNAKTKFNYCCTECRLHFQHSCISSLSEKKRHFAALLLNT